MTAAPSKAKSGQQGDGRKGPRRQRKWWALRCTALATALALGGVPAFADAAGSLAGRTIVVDPGHGGIDSGAVGNGIQEKAITLAIGLDLSQYLRGQGARVVMTRTVDMTVGPGGQRAGLEARTALANRVGASAYVSVHANSLNDPSYRGVVTFYGQPFGYVDAVHRSASLVGQSRALAQDVQRRVIGQTGAINRGVGAADFYVLGNAAMPSILIETGFLTNPAEARQLASPAYEQALASGIAQGVVQFFRDPTPAPAETPSEPVPLPAEAASYVVRSGDTLSGIAARYGIATAGLARLNGIDDPNQIVVGRTLRLSNSMQASTGAVASRTVKDSGTENTATSYTVAPGDTLSAIAARFGVSLRALAEANGLQEVNTIVVGRALAIPGAVATGTNDSAGVTSRSQSRASVTAATVTTYTVRAGDTLSELAQRFGVTTSALAAANGLSDPNQIVVGRTLRIVAPGPIRSRALASTSGPRTAGP